MILNNFGATMKKLIFPLLLISVSSLYANPNFTIGSNPYFTVFAFPHDITEVAE